MPTVILDSFYSVDSNAIWSAAVQNKWNVVRTNSSELQNLNTPDLIFYMGTERAYDLAKKFNCKLISPPLDWLISLPLRYTRRLVKKLTWKEAQTLLVPGFYKPADDKWFQAKVYTSGACIEACSDEVDPNEMVIYSAPVVFKKEYRFFILNRKIMAYSQYAINGKVSKTVEGWPVDNMETLSAYKFIYKLLLDTDVIVPDSLVIDVGLLDTGKWAVVEANPSFCAGLYGCDPAQALLTIQAATKKI